MRTAKIALTVVAGLLLTAGLTTQAHASVTRTPKTPTTTTMSPNGLVGSCSGTNNTTTFWGWCNGTGPASYRAIANCTGSSAVFGVLRWDGDQRQSYANCTINGNNQKLNADWGYLLCSASNGTGTYQGYINKHSDISWMLYNVGNGNITAGGNLLCQFNTSGSQIFNPYTAGGGL